MFWRRGTSSAGASKKPIYHEAGYDGRGGSSYIDSVILRDRDTDADGARDERRYSLQNWRYDVVMIVGSGGYMYERIRYNAYGRPESYALADIAILGGAAIPDASVTADDLVAFGTAFSGGTPTYQCDLVGSGGAGGPDGSVTVDDYVNYLSRFFGTYGGGVGLLSEAAVDNRKGYAGYEYDTVLAGAGGPTSHARYHVRNRVLDSNTGKWGQEDPIGYVDGVSLYDNVQSRVAIRIDPLGLRCSACASSPPGDPSLDPSNPGRRRFPLPDDIDHPDSPGPGAVNPSTPRPEAPCPPGKTQDLNPFRQNSKRNPKFWKRFDPDADDLPPFSVPVTMRVGDRG